jgi:hypothetical protein
MATRARFLIYGQHIAASGDEKWPMSCCCSLSKSFDKSRVFVQVQQVGTDVTRRIDRSHCFLKLQLRTIGCGGCCSSLAS